MCCGSGGMYCEGGKMSGGMYCEGGQISGGMYS